jgi:D-glycero-D-manno-heptose 1,7-bisphosphate phosphatase
MNGVAAILFDRDGTLIENVPYNSEPALVKPVSGAAELLRELRADGIRIGMITNQSGVARGMLTRREVELVNARVAALLGPFDTVQVCPHGPRDRCGCRKPAPGMVLAACAELGIAPEVTAVIGDIEHDVLAAAAAGALGVLVPNEATAPDEVLRAPVVAPNLAEAARLVTASGVAAR